MIGAAGGPIRGRHGLKNTDLYQRVKSGFWHTTRIIHKSLATLATLVMPLKKTLILYGSLEGQTEKIAQRIAQILNQLGHDAEARSLRTLSQDFSLNDVQGVIVGAPVHQASYPGFVLKFVRQRLENLNRLPNAFFSVCMAAYDPSPAGQEETRQYVQKFIRQTGWTPQHAESIAGAVTYTQYNFLVRWVMKMIAKRKHLSTDTSRDHEYTDWDQVRRFAENYHRRHFAD